MLYDDNGISIDGPTFAFRLGRSGQALQVRRLAGRTDRRPGPGTAIAAAITRAQKSNKPSLIACKTTIGFGAPTKAGTNKAHGEALGAEELKGAKEGARHLAGAVLGARRRAEKPGAKPASRGAAAHKEWEERFATLSNRKRAEFDRRLRHERPAALAKAFKAHKKMLLETPQNIATRKSSESVIDAIVTAMPMEFLAGSADLTGSNNNKAKSARNFSAKTPKRPLRPLRHPRASAWPRP